MDATAPRTTPLTETKLEGLNAAKRAAGNAKLLAEKLGITGAAISRWGDEVPLKWVIPVEGATGVSRHTLRPDMFTPPSAATTPHQDEAA